MVQLVHRVFKEIKVLLAQMVLRVNKVFKETKVLPVLKVPQVQME
jgi:hypothetical protein